MTHLVDEESFDPPPKSIAYFCSVMPDEGIADREQVDQLMMDCFRWPSGPYGMVAGAGSGWG